MENSLTYTIFLSTLSLRRAPAVSARYSCPMLISIHALLAESDAADALGKGRCSHFYSLSSWRGRHAFATGFATPPCFPPRLSVGRVTPRICFRCSSVSISIHAPDRPAGLRTIDFYPRSPCGERLGDSGTSRAGETFLSTLSLRRATPERKRKCSLSLFLSTLSLRRATAGRGPYNYRQAISIHALLAESDSTPRIMSRATANFYPRSPCGERRRSP